MALIATTSNRSARRRNEIRLRAIHPNEGLRVKYNRILQDLVREMCNSVAYWMTAAYRANEPTIAADADIDVTKPLIEARPVFHPTKPTQWHVYVDGKPLMRKDGRERVFGTKVAAERAGRILMGEYLPAEELQAAFNEMAVRWQAKFDAAAPKIAQYFATSVAERNDAAMRAALKKAGISVKFQMTPAMNDVVAATVQQNVGLIRSIPQRYLTEVQGEVMRSVQRGRDLGPLTKFLQDQYGVTQRRAALIALDQNNKASGALQQARQVELGITEAIWRHSGGGKHPRPKHVKANGTRYDVTKGLPIGDKGQYVLPGEEINCRCIGVSVIPGF